VLSVPKRLRYFLQRNPEVLSAMPHIFLPAFEARLRARVLRWFVRAGTLDPVDARDIAGWDHGGGFWLDASVRTEGHDRAGLECLLRYCARPPFALERLEQLPDGQILYRFPKPQPDGRTELRLTPLELIERLVALIQPPRGCSGVRASLARRQPSG
jgi:hypothetical protein